MAPPPPMLLLLLLPPAGAAATSDARSATTTTTNKNEVDQQLLRLRARARWSITPLPLLLTVLLLPSRSAERRSLAAGRATTMGGARARQLKQSLSVSLCCARVCASWTNRR